MKSFSCRAMDICRTNKAKTNTIDIGLDQEIKDPSNTGEGRPLPNVPFEEIDSYEKAAKAKFRHLLAGLKSGGVNEV